MEIGKAFQDFLAFGLCQAMNECATKLKTRPTLLLPQVMQFYYAQRLIYSDGQ